MHIRYKQKGYGYIGDIDFKKNQNKNWQVDSNIKMSFQHGEHCSVFY